MSEPFLGEIRIVGFNFAPRGWAFCDGQILPINQNQSLYSLLGTTYGGDGRTSFALPDLRGRTPIHEGGGFQLGQKSGAETITLTAAEMPSHTHTLRGKNGPSNGVNPVGASLAQSKAGSSHYSDSGNGNMSDVALKNTGGQQAHNNMQPFTTLAFCIALQGLFPSRN
ncbi:MAG: phage tail protein [Chitinophagales bacterium]